MSCSNDCPPTHCASPSGSKGRCILAEDSFSSRAARAAVICRALSVRSDTGEKIIMFIDTAFLQQKVWVFEAQAQARRQQVLPYHLIFTRICETFAWKSPRYVRGVVFNSGKWVPLSGSHALPQAPSGSPAPAGICNLSRG